ncbi:MAG: DinB family protein [Planctomycetes bacterium]|nr:DinB family protein [Planctomycetota bacterium]
MDPLLPYRDLLDWTAAETVHWRDWLAARPEAGTVRLATGRLATVADVAAHIAVVDLRYAQRLRGMPVVGFDAFAGAPMSTVFGAATQAHVLFAGWLDQATPAELDGELTFQTLSAGTLTATARTVLMHALLHGARHWAQIATALRQHGLTQDWRHDYLMHRRR